MTKGTPSFPYPINVSKGTHHVVEQCLGPLTGDISLLLPSETTSTEEIGSADGIPPLITRVMVDDFQEVAKPLLSDRSYLYVNDYSSLDDRIQRYGQAWSGLTFRPRVMRNVETVNPAWQMLSHRCRYPFFIPPMGLVGAVHEDGELAFASGAASKGVHYCVSTAATQTHEAIMENFNTTQAQSGMVGQSELFLQLYVHSQPEVTMEFLRRARALGYKGLFITVDTPVIGKRIADRRLQARELVEVGITDLNAAPALEEKPKAGGRVRPGVISMTLNWDDLIWIRKEWSGPIVLKGIQSAADAKMALDLGCQGIYLSNHGGRQLQDAPSSLETLLEIRTMNPEILGRLEIYCDGSFRTGADVLKALCLGATAVAVGRPFMYAVAGYGVKGIERVIDSKYPSWNHFTQD
jgi:L-lactate dehydrogenase (cytochrome)